MGETTNEVTRDDDRGFSGTGHVEGASGAASETFRADQAAADPGNEEVQIRSGIEQTRSEMSQTIDALQEKLDPARIAEQVKDKLKEKATEAYDNVKNTVKKATIGRAERIVSNVSEAVSDVTARAGAAVKNTSLVEYIRENPVPFALVGIGVGMLAFNARRKEQSNYASLDDSYPNGYSSYGRGGYNTGDSWAEAQSGGTGTGIADSARQVVGKVADTARETAGRASSAVSSAAGSVKEAASNAADMTRQQFSQVSDQARRGTQVAIDRAKSTLEENPLAVGVAVLAAGAIVGLSMPSTQVESEYMGEAREQFVNRAKSAAQEALSKVQRVTEAAGRTAKDTAAREGLTTDQSN